MGKCTKTIRCKHNLKEIHVHFSFDNSKVMYFHNFCYSGCLCMPDWMIRIKFQIVWILKTCIYFQSFIEIEQIISFGQCEWMKLYPNESVWVTIIFMADAFFLKPGVLWRWIIFKTIVHRHEKENIISLFFILTTMMNLLLLHVLQGLYLSYNKIYLIIMYRPFSRIVCLRV